MQWLDDGDFLLGWDDTDETYPLEVVEHPAHGRPHCRLLDLAGDRLDRCGQLLTQAVLGWSPCMVA